jgi:hypothetical protein
VRAAGGGRPSVEDASFALDYYQREYVWEEPQVARLMNDLSRKFLAQWSEEHSLHDVSSSSQLRGPMSSQRADSLRPILSYSRSTA